MLVLKYIMELVPMPASMMERGKSHKRDETCRLLPNASFLRERENFEKNTPYPNICPKQAGKIFFNHKNSIL